LAVVYSLSETAFQCLRAWSFPSVISELFDSYHQSLLNHFMFAYQLLATWIQAFVSDRIQIITSCVCLCEILNNFKLFDFSCAFSALMLLVGWQEQHLACINLVLRYCNSFTI